MQLNIDNINSLKDTQLSLPTKESFQYPEKVLQFGTGVLLRGLPDYYIHKANQAGIFKGRVVVVKSTSSGGADSFSEQNGLYTVCVRGTVDGTIVEEDIVNNSISRVVNANTEWDKILETASNKNLRIIISNTTEAGIVDSDDKITDVPPVSFPGKLLAVLLKRFEISPENNFVILPTELISNNGEKLKNIVVNLAKKNNLSSEFIDWISTKNHFCNTLVDRIVPGAYHNENLSYEDKLMIMAEPFGLWAIESDSDEVKQILEFATIDKGIVIAPSIEKFKEIKLRLLNGAHTLSCALSILAGFDTVKQSMQNETFYQLIKTLLLEEIGPAIQSDTISENDIANFSNSVLDRFSNPFLEHKWLSIAVNYTEKFKLRCIPILEKWFNQYQSIPQIFSLGFAAYLQLLSSDVEISDKSRNTIRELWKSSSHPINAILKEKSLWDQDLTQYDGLEEKIKFYLDKNLKQNTMQSIYSVLKTQKLAMKNKVLQIAPKDNVLVALQDLKIGEEIFFNGETYLIQEEIPAKHKVFMQDMQAGDEIFMYGVLVGKTQYFVPKGARMNTDNTKHAAEPFHYRQSHYHWTAPDVSKYKDRTFNGYVREDGRVGTANYWLFVPTVFCENRNLDIIKEALYNELGYEVTEKYKSFTHQLVKAYNEHESLSAIENIDLSPTIERKNQRLFKNVDGIKFLNHQGGCGGTRQDAGTLGKLLAAYADHPNVAGITVLSLGCQNLQVADFKQYLLERNPNFNKPLYIFEQQTAKSEEELIKEAILKTFEGLIEINKIERQPASLDKLVIGVKCGGSDGFSGISANPSVGYTSDLVTALGGKILLAEFPELCGAEQNLIDRTVNKDAAEKFIHLMRTYNKAAENVGSGFYMNPSPGNIKDGLITDAIKSTGAAKKGGTSPVVDVLDYTEPATKPGLNLVCTPGNDVEATTGKTASGATLILFTTGLGTPTGNPICPVIKVSTNNALAQRMSDIIDINTGSVIDGDKTIEQMGEDILEYCIKAASGEVIPKAVLLNQDDFIPWKRGVSL